LSGKDNSIILLRLKHLYGCAQKLFLLTIKQIDFNPVCFILNDVAILFNESRCNV